MNSGALAGFCGHHTKLLMPTPKCRRGSTRVEYAAVRIPYTVPSRPQNSPEFPAVPRIPRTMDYHVLSALAYKRISLSLSALVSRFCGESALTC